MEKNAQIRDRSIIDAVQRAELPEGMSPYSTAFAGTGTSGLSFGRFQHDVANNSGAREKLKQLLTTAVDANGAPILNDAEREKFAALAARKGIKAGDFEREAPGLSGKIGKALDSKAGRAMVDELDRAQAERLDGYRQQLEDAAKKNPGGPGAFDPSHPDYPQVMAMAVQWGNRTGGVDKLSKWAAGGAVDLATTTGRPEVARSDGAPSLGGLGGYFAKTKYFRDDRPTELPKWTEKHGRIARENAAKAPGNPLESQAPGKGPELEATRQPETRQPGQEPERPKPFVPDASDRDPAAEFLRQDRQMPRTSPGLEPRDAGRDDPLLGGELPRPVNLLTDPLPPEDDPYGLVPPDALRYRRGGGPAEAPEAMSTLDFIKESFRDAAQGDPEEPRPRRPAGFMPSNPEEQTSAEYIWEMFNRRGVRQNSR